MLALEIEIWLWDFMGMLRLFLRPLYCYTFETLSSMG